MNKHISSKQHKSSTSLSLHLFSLLRMTVVRLAYPNLDPFENNLNVIFSCLTFHVWGFTRCISDLTGISFYCLSYIVKLCLSDDSICFFVKEGKKKSFEKQKSDSFYIIIFKQKQGGLGTESFFFRCFFFYFYFVLKKLLLSSSHSIPDHEAVISVHPNMPHVKKKKVRKERWFVLKDNLFF